jgi:hypothetical protein
MKVNTSFFLINFFKIFIPIYVKIYKKYRIPLKKGFYSKKKQDHKKKRYITLMFFITTKKV